MIYDRYTPANLSFILNVLTEYFQCKNLVLFSKVEENILERDTAKFLYRAKLYIKSRQRITAELRIRMELSPDPDLDSRSNQMP